MSVPADDGGSRESPRVCHRALYCQIPAMRCVPGCSSCCEPAPVSPWEAEWLGIPGATVTPVHPGTARCRFLVDGACSVYVRRPFACRLYGITSVARCDPGARADPTVELPVAKAITPTRRFEVGCPPSWHVDRRRAVRSVVERDGSDAERRALDDHRERLGALSQALGLDER